MFGGLGRDHFKMMHLMRNVNFTLSSGWCHAPSAEVLHHHIHHALHGSTVGVTLTFPNFNCDD